VSSFWLRVAVGGLRGGFLNIVIVSKIEIYPLQPTIHNLALLFSRKSAIICWRLVYELYERGMIASVRGTVLDISPTSIVVEAGGVGYRIFATPATLGGMRKREEAFLYTYDLIREDAHDLYGFISQDEQRLFERLISVSGVGPKVAIALLSMGSAAALKRAIMSGDLSALTSVSGVGRKIAQKIILELKGQIVEEGGESGPDREVVDALVSLGYSASQAREALKGVSNDVTDVSDRVREALRRLSS
jgi:Holliday junction DNA helicase RuvA